LRCNGSQTSRPSGERPSFVRVKRMGHPALFVAMEEGLELKRGMGGTENQRTIDGHRVRESLAMFA
jgi:hypothetical protein